MWKIDKYLNLAGKVKGYGTWRWQWYQSWLGPLNPQKPQKENRGTRTPMENWKFQTKIQQRLARIYLEESWRAEKTYCYSDSNKDCPLLLVWKTYQE